METIGVKFDNDDKIYYYYSDIENLKENLTVVASKENGVYFGKIVTKLLDNEKNVNDKIIRIATKKDYNNYKNNIKESADAILKCRELIHKYNLNMKILDATFTLSKDQLLFHFYSEERIDFRNLAKDLAAIYKTRIELRQIGVRDKAKKIGGCGSCGQELCCKRYLNTFNSVTISMAKNQNLSLNPSKINGVCGRLLCCLKYENDNYTSCRKELPKIGTLVSIDGKEGKVIDLNILKRTYMVEIPNIGLTEVSACNGSN